MAVLTGCRYKILTEVLSIYVVVGQVSSFDSNKYLLIIVMFLTIYNV